MILNMVKILYYNSININVCTWCIILSINALNFLVLCILLLVAFNAAIALV